MTKNIAIIIVFWLAQFLSVSAFTDYVVVSRTVNVKATPDKDSLTLQKGKKGDTFALSSTTKINRYYSIVLPESNDIGWVYDNRVKVVESGLPSGQQVLAPGGACERHLHYGVPHQSDTILCHDGYALGYNNDGRVPDWVSYVISDESANGVNVDRGSFRVDKAIDKDNRSSNTDYKKTGYDRGHLAPSGSIDYSREANDETFLYSNMSPQLPAFNRDMHGKTGVWGRLERYERAWAKQRGKLLIIAGTYLGENTQLIGRGVRVPEKFFKVIFDPSSMEAIAFIMPQDLNTGDDWKQYVASIDQVESLTGWDLLSVIDADIQATIEANTADITAWPLHVVADPDTWCENRDKLAWGDVSLAELTHKCTPEGWEVFFAQEEVKKQIQLISDHLDAALADTNTTLSPSLNNVFRALYEVRADKAKAIIMGQDPAPQPGLATGLSFSLPPETPTSKVASVQRVYLEAQNEEFCNNLEDADASRWADEDVLLLNMALTIPCNAEGVCYSGIAKHVPLWTEFTQLLMEYIDTLEQPMAFILWGSKARAYDVTVKNPLHSVFEGGHPSPKANGAAFFCKNYFSCSNSWLAANDAEPIDWSLTGNTCQTREPCIYTWNSRTRTSSCETACEQVACDF